MTVFNGSLAILNISPLRRIQDSRLRKEESQRDGRQFGQTQEKVNWVKRSFKEDDEKENMGWDVWKLKTQYLIIGKEASGEENCCLGTCRRVEDIRIKPGEAERLLC